MNPAQQIYDILQSRVGIEHFIPNAVLLLPVPAAGTTVDPVTGNEVPNQTVLRVIAYARPDGDFGKAKPSATPGGPEIIEQLRGFCIYPPEIPSQIPSIDWIPAYVSGFRGELHWAPRVDSPFQINQILGAKFYGKFVRYSGRFVQEEISTAAYTFSQVLEPITAASAIPQYSVITKNSNGLAAPYTNSSISAYRVLGLATAAAAPGGSITPLTLGNLTNPTWAWTPGARLYLADDGTLSEAPGSVVFPIGYAITATNINIFIGFPD